MTFSVSKWSTASVLLAATLFFSFGSTVQAATFVDTFDTPPAGWIPDRYAPAGFTAPTPFMGDNRLQITISSADSGNNRPSSFSSSFYNTQGMKKTNPDPTNTFFTSIDFYLTTAAISDPNRQFGLWGVGYNGPLTPPNANISAYAIIEFANGQFRGWDDANGFVDYGLPSGITGDQWVTMAFSLDTANDLINYYVNGVLLGSVSALGTLYFGETILEGYNTQEGRTYSFYLDNLTLSDGAGEVPIPAALPLFASGLGIMGFVAHRRKRKAAA